MNYQTEWYDAKYPFDGTAGCGECLTIHTNKNVSTCKLAEHAELRRVAKELNLRPTEMFDLSPERYEVYLATRKLFAHLYKHNPTEASEAPAEQLEEVVQCT